MQNMRSVASMISSAKRQDKRARGYAYLLNGVIQIEGLSKCFGISTEAWSRLQFHEKSPTAGVLNVVPHAQNA